MPLPLREPFFLKGRTSVVQRAVSMSLVLGGLSGLAGWAIAAATLIALEMLSSTMLAHFLCAVWTVAALAIVYGPLNYWNRRPLFWTFAAAPLSYGAMFAFQELADVNNSAANLAWMSFVFAAFSAVSGLPLVRPRCTHALAYVASVTAAIVPTLIAHLIHHGEWPASLGITDGFAFLLSFALWFSSWLAALAIPWGIPFWWPPAKEAGAEM